MPIITAASVELSLAIISLVGDVGVAAAEAYVRRKEQRGEPVTADEITAMITDHKPTGQILAEMGIDV